MDQDTVQPVVPDSADIASTQLAVPGDVLPNVLHLLPLQERPFFPIHVMPLILDEGVWLETITEIGKTAHHTAGLVFTHPGSPKKPSTENFFEVGTAVRMREPIRRDGRIQFVAEGVQRFRIVKWLSDETPFLAQVEYLDDESDEDDTQIKAYAMALIGVIKELIPLNPLYNEQLKQYLDRFTPNHPASLTYFAANMTTATGVELQQILQTTSLLERMENVLALLKKELEAAKLHAEISREVEAKISEQQRNFFLKEQLKVIQKELGITKDDRTAELDRLKERMQELELDDTTRARIQEELDKLAILEVGSPEYAVTRNYLDWITSLPWGRCSEDQLDLEHAREILDADHTGLEDVKDRIIEFLAVGKLRGEVAGSILLLVGPPGVGKTSIGRSVAAALGREFYRFSLGGMRDEAEIKGHRRTYIGAMPGKFIQALKEVDVANPVIMLDEIDKIGASYRGDPASALLEVLDPEQNQAFLDHYLDVRFDLSRTLFICTANQLDTIPRPLLDRMEVIRLSGYIAAEKQAIAREHLWPRVVDRAGLKSSRITVSDAALKRIVDGYAREAGVRELEKRLSQIARKAAVRVANGVKDKIRVGTRNLEDFLGKPLYKRSKPISGVGVVTGLAWTALGGATLDIEASRVHTKNRGFHLTGKLGDVMQESAQIAYSYVVSHLDEYQGDPEFFDRAFVHLHVPEGATPKDGPSAGITMASALLSLARGQRVPPRVAMTGELTLTGHVLAVGGIREKVIAARRNRVREILVPEANRGDIEELPDYLKEGLTVHFVAHYRDVFAVLFERRKKRAADGRAAA